jgi:high-affinity nickel-transport protein
MSLLSILALGFFLGMRHATDADHVVAVTTIVSRERSVKAAAIVGALWGLGHSATLFLVGGALLVFRFVVPPQLGLGMEMAVALMLIVLGGLNLGDAFHRIEHAARGRGVEIRDDHPRIRRAVLAPAGRVVRPVIVGVVHGLAGSAAIALLVLTTIRERGTALEYLAVFGVGTIGGMMLLTAAMAMPLAAATEHFATFDRTMARATGLLSVALGAYLCYRVGFVDGLFSAHARWTPE